MIEYSIDLWCIEDIEGILDAVLVCYSFQSFSDAADKTWRL